MFARIEFENLPEHAGRHCRNRIDAKHRLAGATDNFIGDADQAFVAAAPEEEAQNRKLAEVLIATFDILDRMLSVFTPKGPTSELYSQTQQAIDLCLHNAGKVGLVALGEPGEPFDTAIHALTRELPHGQSSSLRVASVATRGYALNGKVLRRAEVDYIA